MFIAHFALPLAVKQKAPEIPLWLLLLAGISIDLFSFSAIQFHLDRFIPFMGHTLVFAFIMSVGFLLIGRTLTIRVFPLLCLFLLPLSHVVLDYLSSSIAWWDGGPKTGLSLYAFPLADFLIESITFILCTMVYRNEFGKTPKRNVSLIFMCGVVIAAQAVFNFALSVAD